MHSKACLRDRDGAGMIFEVLRMDREVFEQSKETLGESVIGAIERHFHDMEIRFNTGEFLAQNAAYFDQLITSAHFDGAEVFPVDIPTKTPT